MAGTFSAAIERDIVRASGPDTITYLQGQLSQDIAAIPVGGSAWSLLLQPTGKVDAWLRVARLGDDDVQLDVDAGFGQAVLDRLKRFLLRTKCELELRAGITGAAVRGTAVRGTAVRGASGDGLVVVWPGVDGYDVLDAAADLPPVDQSAYERLRIACGVPAMGAELTDDTIPAEAGQWLIDASVSFTKGCYTGQELVARIDSRGGRVPKPIRVIVVDGHASVDDEVTVDGAVVGRLTSATPSEDGTSTLALAPIARSVEPPAGAEVGGSAAKVLTPPLP
ncbi:MAG: tRNA-modifying protein YgfZ [Acidimicrobiaceae bacterium]